MNGNKWHNEDIFEEFIGFLQKHKAYGYFVNALLYERSHMSIKDLPNWCKKEEPSGWIGGAFMWTNENAPPGITWGTLNAKWHQVGWDKFGEDRMLYGYDVDDSDWEVVR